MNALLVGIAVACAVVGVTGPPGRPPVRLAVPRAGDASSRIARSPAPERTTVDLAAALLVVVAELRAGARPAVAWGRALGPVDLGRDVPTAMELLVATTPQPAGALPRRLRAWQTKLVRARGGPFVQHTRAHRERVAAVLAATALADDLGAPLAGVLERLAGAIAADAEAESEMRAAIAGPRATAGVLTWLPVLGLLVGAALGAEPVAAVREGGLGAGAACLGVGLLLAGRGWTRALLRRAADGGRAS
ncbi:type II secretion system F family protein [Cellulomonas sp. URHB0016]